MANYRALQTDFSAGELDAMVDGNVTNPFRPSGVKLSNNAYHMAQGPVIKRPGSSFLAILDETEAPDASLEVQLSGGQILLLFYPGKIYAIYEDSLTRPMTFSTPVSHKGSHFAVNKNLIVETNKDRFITTYDIKIADGKPVMTSKQLSPADDCTGWIWTGQNPVTCCFASGRLLLGWGDTVVASRTPLDGEDRFFDFTLADHTYTWEMGYEHQSIGTAGEGLADDRYDLKETVSCKSDTGFTSSPKQEEIVKRAQQFTRYAIRLPRKVNAETIAGDYLYIPYSPAQWTAKGYATKAIDAIVNEIWTSDTTDMYKTWEGGLEKATKAEALERAQKAKLVTTITDNYSGGEKTLTTIGLLATITMKDGEEYQTNEHTWKNPIYDKQAGDVYVIDEATKIDFPDVSVSHGIEVHENDMSSSPIQWMANIGRIIVGTENALFISTTGDVISPHTFDLVPSVYLRTASDQPRIFLSQLVALSRDRKKIYSLVYQDEYKGMTATELTASANSLFEKGISDFNFALEPASTLFIASGGAIYAGNLKPTQYGTIYAFSRWNVNDCEAIGLYLRRNLPEGRGDALYTLQRPTAPESPTFSFFTKSVFMHPSEYAAAASLPLVLDIEAEVPETLRKEEGELRFTLSASSALSRYIELFHWRGAVEGQNNQGEPVKYYVTGVSKIEGTASDYRIEPKTLADNIKTGTLTLGLPVEMEVELYYSVLPNNSGFAMISKHSVQKVSVQVYESLGGTIRFGRRGRPVDIGMGEYGIDRYRQGIGRLTLYSGVYGISSPQQVTDTRDGLLIENREAFPFCLQAVETKYNVTEVN